MDNWMEKFERKRDEVDEKKLNTKLEKFLNLLDEVYREEDRVKIIQEIIKIYDEMKRNFCDYDEKDYIAKKKELAEIRYKIKKQEYMESIEAQSWNEYKEEEQIEEDNER